MNDPSRELFEHYRTGYERCALPFFQSLAEVERYKLDRMPRWIDEIPLDARVLDIGCASGYLLSLLSAKGFRHLVGVDLSPPLIEAARERLPTASLHCTDLREFLRGCEDGTFDVIFCHHVLEHIPREDTIPMLRELHRCLKPGGSLSLRVPNAGHLLAGVMCYGDFTHVVHFNEWSLSQVLERAGFAYEAIEVNRKPPRLFWSVRDPIRMMFRLLNRLRWHLHGVVHWSVAVLSEARPRLRCFEQELEMRVRR